jgi:hypothetical protein
METIIKKKYFLKLNENVGEQKRKKMQENTI